MGKMIGLQRKFAQRPISSRMRDIDFTIKAVLFLKLLYSEQISHAVPFRGLEVHCRAGGKQSCIQKEPDEQGQCEEASGCTEMKWTFYNLVMLSIQTLETRNTQKCFCYKNRLKKDQKITSGYKALTLATQSKHNLDVVL